MYTHCVAKCALPVCSVIRAALGQLTAMLLKNVVSIGYKQGISVDPLMWPIYIYSLLTVLVLQKVYHITYKYTEEKNRPTKLGTPYNKVCFRSDTKVN